MAEETEVQETTQDSTPDGSEAEVQPEEVSGESSQTGFQLASLSRLKSNNEVERYVATLEGAVKEQGARLTAAETTRPVVPVPVEPEGERKGFWDGPEDYLKRDREILLGEMREMVSPFHSDLSASKETRARIQIRSEFGEEWDRYEPVVNGLLAEGQAQGLGVDPTNTQMLRTLFYTAKGYMAAEGPKAETPKPSIPQHRPSGAPLPDETGGKPVLRELTENERRLAKEAHMTHEEYLHWQTMDEGDVIETELTDA